MLQFISVLLLFLEKLYVVKTIWDQSNMNMEKSKLYSQCPV